MADTARLPEVFDFQGLAVRCFPAERATGFPRLSQAERRAIPAIVRRLYKAAAIYAAEDADCLICGEAAPIEGRVLVAVETDGGHELGVVCADCARLAEFGCLDAVLTGASQSNAQRRRKKSTRSGLSFARSSRGPIPGVHGWPWKGPESANSCRSILIAEGALPPTGDVLLRLFRAGNYLAEFRSKVQEPLPHKEHWTVMVLAPPIHETV